ncbi:hypothetical protein ACFL06_00135 [Patescibacteria group bacterium]
MTQFFKKTKKIVIRSLLPILASLLIVVAVIYAWDTPDGPPPTLNVPAPINVGPIMQAKEAGLWLAYNPLTPVGLIVEYGNVGIGTSSPQTTLHLQGPSGIPPMILFSSTSPVSAGQFYREDGAKTFHFGEPGDAGQWNFQGGDVAIMEGNLGIGSGPSGAHELFIVGDMRLVPISSPPLVEQGVIYFDDNEDAFKCSEDGATFKNCISGGAGFWEDGGAYIYPSNVGSVFQVANSGDLTVSGTTLNLSGTYFEAESGGKLGIRTTPSGFDITLGGTVDVTSNLRTQGAFIAGDGISGTGGLISINSPSTPAIWFQEGGILRTAMNWDDVDARFEIKPSDDLAVIGPNDSTGVISFVKGEDTAVGGEPGLNVGIGTTNPLNWVVLDVVGDSFDYSGLRILGVPPRLIFQTVGEDEHWQNWQSSPSGDLHWEYCNTETCDWTMAHDPGGYLAIRGNLNVGGGVVEILGPSATAGCLKIRDTDDAGWTYCTTLNGTLSCNTTGCP